MAQHCCPHCGNPLKLLPVSKSFYCLSCEMIVSKRDARDGLKRPEASPGEAGGAGKAKDE